VVTANDPNHCGGCSACAGGKVCAANSCLGSCLPGTQNCNGSCVDQSTDEKHCGASCTDCTATGGVCVGGTCRTNSTGDFKRTDPNACVGGGPPIYVNPGSRETCVGNLAQVSFNFGIGSCHGISTSDSIYVDGFNSLAGGYNPAKPQLGGGVGANASYNDDGATNIYGDLWGFTGISTSARDIHHDLYSGGNVSGSPTVDDKAFIVGSGGVSGPANPATKVTSIKQPVNCTPIDVAGIVAARATNNDDANVTPALTPDILSKAGAPAQIDLPCGNFYFTGITQPTTIVAHGRTAIYVQGNIGAGGPLKFTLDPTAELDIFVTGTVTAEAALSIGSVNYPALTRVYIGSSSFDVQDGATYGANIWAANAHTIWESSTDYFGTIVVGSLDNEDSIKLHQDTAILSAGRTCPQPGSNGAPDGGSTSSSSSGGPPPPPPGPGTLPDGGIAPTGCTTCTDCGNQACLPGGQCGACTSDSQCCAPLICGTGGTCIVAVLVN
jgi:hypothetical protein